MGKREAEFYQALHEKIHNWMQTEEGKSHRWSRYINYAPDLFHLICRLSMDKAVPKEIKAKLAPVMAYFVSPYDYIPEEFWGALGYVDDLALVAYALNQLQAELDSQILDKYWQNETPLSAVISDILQVAEEMVGEEYWPKLKDLT